MAAKQTVETQLALMNQMWEQHTRQDMEQFEALALQLTEMNTWLSTLDDKMDAARIREAHRSGEFTATRKAAGVVAGVVSLFVSVLGVIAMFLVV